MNHKPPTTYSNTQKEFQLPTSFSYEKSMGLIGNSFQVKCARYFLEKMIGNFYQKLKPFKFVDLFCGIGGFHVALAGFGKCRLASDNNKDCQAVYQLNFPNTPFLLGDINDKEIQEQIISTNFNLLCAGFPCQPYSKANTSKNKKDTVIGSLLKIIEQKRPDCLFLENVPQLVKYPI
jgi:DNA (cytosine-5)-methyltransferase 1